MCFNPEARSIIKRAIETIEPSTTKEQILDDLDLKLKCVGCPAWSKGDGAIYRDWRIDRKRCIVAFACEVSDEFIGPGKTPCQVL